MIAPEQAWHQVQEFNQILHSGESGIGVLPGYLSRLLESGAWREFQPPVGPVRRNATFRDFVEAKPMDGLGTTVEVIEGLLKAHPDKARRASAMRALKKAKEVGRGTYGRGRPSENGLGRDESSSPNGSGLSDYLLQRLHDQAPDQYALVQAGTLSVNAAAIAAGFRPRRVSVRTDDPSSAVASLLRHYTREQLLAALEGP